MGEHPTPADTLSKCETKSKIPHCLICWEPCFKMTPLLSCGSDVSLVLHYCEIGPEDGVATFVCLHSSPRRYANLIIRPCPLGEQILVLTVLRAFLS